VAVREANDSCAQSRYSWSIVQIEYFDLSLFQELKRRHVVKVGIAYVVVAWLLLQVSDVILGQIGVPDWMFKALLFFLIICFPVILMLAWAYDLTPAGLQRTPAVDADEAEASKTVPAVAPSRASVAVLPFVNMSGDKENEYFSDGLSEELLNVLAKVNSLKVAARTSSFHFKGHTGDIADIAQTLGVASVLEGSVRQSGVQVRITAQLINADDGYHLWSETYDRELDDIFEVQDEIAKAVAAALKVKLLGDDGEHLNVGGTTNTEAFNAYLKGMHFRNRGSDEPALRSAVEAYQHAIDLDPEYAQAYAGLAGAISVLAANNFSGLGKDVDEAYEAAIKSIELVPGLADGYVWLADLEFSFKLNNVAAQKAIDTALKLDPGNVRVHTQHARMGFCTGDFEGALASARMALELDPISASAGQMLAYSLYFAREYEEAVEVTRRTLELDSHFPRPHYTAAMSLYQLGEFEAAAQEIEHEPLSWMRRSGRAIVQHKLGNEEAANAAFAALIRVAEDNGLYQQAQIHAQWGDLEKSLEDLNRAREIGDPGMSQIVSDPLLDPLRDEPEFARLMTAVGYG